MLKTLLMVLMLILAPFAVATGVGPISPQYTELIPFLDMPAIEATNTQVIERYWRQNADYSVPSGEGQRMIACHIWDEECGPSPPPKFHREGVDAVPIVLSG